MDGCSREEVEAFHQVPVAGGMYRGERLTPAQARKRAEVVGFLMATLYDPAASCPGISEFVEWLGTTILQGVGKLTGSEEFQKAKARASVGRALIDFGGMYKSATKMYDMFTDDKEYGWSEYTKTAMRAGKAVSVLAGSTGTSVGYAYLFLQTLLNPVDFAAKVGDAWFAGEEE